MKFESIALLVLEKMFKIDIFNIAARATVLDFQSEWFQVFLIYKSPPYFLSNFKPMGLFIQKTKFKIDFQDGNGGTHKL